MKNRNKKKNPKLKVVKKLYDLKGNWVGFQKTEVMTKKKFEKLYGKIRDIKR